MPVYFITDGEKVKIGRSSTPDARLKDLQVGHHKKLFIILTVSSRTDVSDSVLEGQLQSRFARYRVRGEWFELKGDLERYIKQFSGYDVTASHLFHSIRERRYVTVPFSVYIKNLSPQVVEYYKAMHLERFKNGRLYALAASVALILIIVSGYFMALGLVNAR